MPLFNTEMHGSAVFTENGTFNDRPLKDKNAIREAFVLNELSHLPLKQLKEFVKSNEAKFMLEEEIISSDTLEHLVKNTYGDRDVEFLVCHLAKENNDEDWEELVRLRAEERKKMNDLIDKYGEDAKAHCCKFREAYVNKCVTKTFRTTE